LIRHNRSRRPEQCIEEARLAHVGLSRDDE
jgi:hypothetical protein